MVPAMALSRARRGAPRDEERTGLLSSLCFWVVEGVGVARLPFLAFLSVVEVEVARLPSLVFLFSEATPPLASSWGALRWVLVLWTWRAFSSEAVTPQLFLPFASSSEVLHPGREPPLSLLRLLANPQTLPIFLRPFFQGYFLSLQVLEDNAE